MRLLVLAELCALSACTFPEHTFREPGPDAAVDVGTDTARADGSAPDSSDAGPETDAPIDATSDGPKLPPPTICPDGVWISGCSPIPELTGSVVLDGDGKEFCALGLRSRGFYVATAKTTPSPAPASFKQKVLVRAGLTAAAYVVHVSVFSDPAILVDATDLVQGDAVEIFVRGKRPPTGPLVTDGARHVVLTPPTATTGPMGAYYVDGKRFADVDGAHFAGRLVEGGYEVELHLPWTVLGDQPAPGDKVGLDVAVDIKDDPSAKARGLRALMQLTTVTPTPTCSALGAPLDPACDDRTWCLAGAYL